MITHAAPQKHYTVLLSRPVRGLFAYKTNFFRASSTPNERSAVQI